MNVHKELMLFESDGKIHVSGVISATAEIWREHGEAKARMALQAIRDEADMVEKLFFAGRA